LYNQPLTDVASIIWDVPVGRGRQWGGWRLGLINNVWGPQPVNLTWTVSPQFQVSSDTVQRPNVLGPIMLPVDKRTAQQSFVVANVVIPKDPSQPFGTTVRNIGLGFPLYDIDVGQQKEFLLHIEKMRLQFRAEAFNLFNHTNFNAPSGDRSATTFDEVSSTEPARELQFGAKLYW
jgi:hypothetical protein